MNLDEVRIIDLPKVLDDRGNLSFFQNNDQLPFEMKRVYWIYDVPGGEQRGGHAYIDLQEVIVALSGSFDVVLNDGKVQRTYTLNRSYYGLYVPKMIWRHLDNFSTNALAFIATNSYYEENQYLRDFDIYKKMRNEQ
jgi:dTDP-4-dehydrorhamnose 3,5-epimerase-like enzyme